MGQMTLVHQASFERYGKKTRREQFLEEMDAAMPWAELLALIEPHYPKGEMSRKPGGLDIVLRVYFLQQWFALSDPGVEDALYEPAGRAPDAPPAAPSFRMRDRYIPLDCRSGCTVR